MTRAEILIELYAYLSAEDPGRSDADYTAVCEAIAALEASHPVTWTPPGRREEGFSRFTLRTGFGENPEDAL